MTQIKICGITRLEDALCAAESGADAVGFIFHVASSRSIEPKQASRIIAALPAGLVKVGVFVNRAADEVEMIVEECGLDLIQLHGDESPEYCRRFPPERVIKAVFLRSAEDLGRLAGYDVRAFLADFREAGLWGGTGKRADWGLAARLAGDRPLILAGGVNVENISEALRTVAPAAVDINSGIEKEPGVKDHNRMRRIVGIVRTAGVSGQPGNGEIFRKPEGIVNSGDMFRKPEGIGMCPRNKPAE